MVRQPLGVVSRLVFSQWRVYLFNFTSAVDMETPPTVLNVALGNLVVGINAVGCATVVLLTYGVIYGHPLLDCLDGPYWYRN